MTKQNCTSINQSKQQKVKERKYGVGYNSGGSYEVDTLEYKVWSSMLYRCYCPTSHAKRPTYIGCTVTKEWHDFQEFAAWYINNKHYGMGYELDKDLLVKGNKVYSSDTCCLVPARVNSLLLTPKASKGDQPTGVDLHRGKFRSRVWVNKKRVHVGYFSTAKEAHEAYIVAKESYVKEVADEYKGLICDKVYQALMVWTF